MAGKKTWQAKKHATSPLRGIGALGIPNRCARPSSRLPVFPSSSSPSLTSSLSSSSQRRRRRHETVSILFRFFSASSLGARDRTSFEIRMRSKCLSNDARCASNARAFAFERRRKRKKTQRSSRSTQTNAPSGDVSLRRGQADGLGGSSLGQGEHGFMCVLKRVLLKMKTIGPFFGCRLLREGNESEERQNTLPLSYRMRKKVSHYMTH